MVIRQDTGVRTRKNKDTYRKDNYWVTRSSQDGGPWYVWGNDKPVSRGNHEEKQYKNKYKPAENIFKDDFRSYLLTSTLHGLRYIGEKKLTWFERFFWLASFVCSIACAGFFIMNVYGKWRQSPMIVTINPKNTLLSSMPFPALTICNMNQAKRSVAERYMEYGTPMDKKLLQSLCENRRDRGILFEDDVAINADWDHTRTFLINVTQPCAEMLAMCVWDSTKMSCGDLFNAQLTDEGLCCTFNVVHRNNMFRNPRDVNDLNLTFPLPAVDWTPENGYPEDAPEDGFPWRPKGTGTLHGLTLALDANIDEYFCASTLSAGFKVLLHNPVETPKIKDIGALYSPGMETRVVIKPRIVDAQPALRTIDISKRLCFFSSEKELMFYRTYTLKNCEMECKARVMLDLCNCVSYYMPKNKTTRICGKSDAKCYSDLYKLNPGGPHIICQECLPACTEIAYIERASSAPLREGLIQNLANDLSNKSLEYLTENMLVMHFYFEDNNFVRYTKGEIFGLTEFLSNTGGLLGLCMGFSVMSVIELLYYLTLRAYCNAKKRKPKQRFVT